MKRTILLTICVSALCLAGMSRAAAQGRRDGVSVTGIVVDPRRAPVAEAAVTLSQEPGAVVGSAKTDTAGRFHFDGVADGDYSIEVEHEGFARSVTALRVRGRTAAPLTVGLALPS